jgi:hypothetical protein
MNVIMPVVLLKYFKENLVCRFLVKSYNRQCIIFRLRNYFESTAYFNI